MRHILILLAVFTLLFTDPIAAQKLTGTVINQSGAPIIGARVTLFNNDTTLFWETRSNSNGQYLFDSLPGGAIKLYFGVAKPDLEYFEDTTTAIIGTIVHNVTLVAETQTGVWTTIMNSPEPLGGTDLGILLPNGDTYFCHNTKDPFVFSPELEDTTSVPGDAQVQGCVAPKLLWNGNIIMAGGTDQEVYGPGTRQVKQYNIFTKTWHVLPLMLDYRWYPSMTQLADGRLLITGGGGKDNPVRVNTTELYDPITGETEWADTLAVRNEQSPILTLYNGNALMTHRPPQLFNPWTAQWDLAADFVQGNRMPNGDHADHELVLMPEGNVIAIGYKPFPSGSRGSLVEHYNPITNTWRLGTHFAPLRSRPETVLLPTRHILVLGGEKEDPSDPTPVNKWNYMNLSDLYNPYTDTWRRLTPMPREREYHALAILVPDGRVVVVGGEGQPGNEPSLSIIDAFEPPYLFRGIRPQIFNLERIDYRRGETIRFETSRTNAPTSVALQSIQAVTHMMNCGENRFLDLGFVQRGVSKIEATIPNDSLRTLPGWYLLWIMVDDIPSKAQIIRILPGKPVINVVKNAELNTFRVFPIPAVSDGLLTVEMYPGWIGKVNFDLVDRIGKVVHVFSFAEKTNGNQVLILNTIGVPSGVYILRARIDQKVVGTQKVVLQ